MQLRSCVCKICLSAKNLWAGSCVSRKSVLHQTFGSKRVWRIGAFASWRNPCPRWKFQRTFPVSSMRPFTSSHANGCQFNPVHDIQHEHCSLHFLQDGDTAQVIDGEEAEPCQSHQASQIPLITFVSCCFTVIILQTLVSMS